MCINRLCYLISQNIYGPKGLGKIHCLSLGHPQQVGDFSAKEDCFFLGGLSSLTGSSSRARVAERAMCGLHVLEDVITCADMESVD